MMHFDFAAALVLAAFITGVIWALDSLVWAPKRRITTGDARLPVVVDYARSFFPLIVLVLVLRSFLGEPFRIPSGSMMPTLMAGDFILVNKFTYGIRLPVIETKIIEVGAPRRGDIVVFRFPSDPSVDFIKRVVGLPGDHIVYRDKRLFVNGEEYPQRAVGPYGEIGPWKVQLREERINGTDHGILVIPGRELPELEFYVPEGEYFVMGDNRDNSNDSREWGTVPDENLVGRAILVWMSWAPGNGPIWDRIGTRIQ